MVVNDLIMYELLEIPKKHLKVSNEFTRKKSF